MAEFKFRALRVGLGVTGLGRPAERHSCSAAGDRAWASGGVGLCARAIARTDSPALVRFESSRRPPPIGPCGQLGTGQLSYVFTAGSRVDRYGFYRQR